jgi:hypothetical protein
VYNSFLIGSVTVLYVIPYFAAVIITIYYYYTHSKRRYIKRRMGNDLKNQILVHNGIPEQSAATQRKLSVISCARCSLVNPVDVSVASVVIP